MAKVSGPGDVQQQTGQNEKPKIVSTEHSHLGQIALIRNLCLGAAFDNNAARAPSSLGQSSEDL